MSRLEYEKLGIGINAKDKGLKGDGIANDATALNALIVSVGTTPTDLHFPSGTYKLDDSVTQPSNVRFVMVNGAVFSVSSGDTLTLNGEIDAGLYQIFSGEGIIAGTFSCKDDAYIGWFLDMTQTTLTVAEATKLERALNLCSNQNVIFPKSRTYVLDRTPIIKGCSNMNIDINDCTLKMKANPVFGFRETIVGNTCLAIVESSGITINNININGNKANMTPGVNDVFGIIVHDSENVKVDNIYLYDINYHPIYVMTPFKNVEFNNVKLYDNYGAATAADIVLDGEYDDDVRVYNVKGSRSAVVGQQVFYNRCRNSDIQNVEFTNCPKSILDYRRGRHTFRNIRANNCAGAVIIQSTTGVDLPEVMGENIIVRGGHGTEGSTGGVYIAACDSVNIKNIDIQMNPLLTTPFYAIRITPFDYTIKDVVLESVIMSGATVAGIYIDKTTNPALITNIISNLDAAVPAIKIDALATSYDVFDTIRVVDGGSVINDLVGRAIVKNCPTINRYLVSPSSTKYYESVIDSGALLLNGIQPRRVPHKSFEIFDDFDKGAIVEASSPWILNKGSDGSALDPYVTDAISGRLLLTTGADASGTVATDGSQIVCRVPVLASYRNLSVEARFNIVSSITGLSINFGLTDSNTLEEPFEIGGADAITSHASDACCFVYDAGATTKRWFACAVDSDADDSGNGLLDTLLLQDCENVWNEITVAGVTPATDAVDYKTGTKCATFALDNSVGVTTIGAIEIPLTDISAYTHISFWFKSDVALSSADFQLLLDATAACASPDHIVNIPAISANTWTFCEVSLSSGIIASNSIISVGLKQAVDKGACNIKIDDIRMYLAPVSDSGNRLRDYTLRIDVDSTGNTVKFYGGTTSDNLKLMKTLNNAGITPSVNMYATFIANSTGAVSKTVEVDYMYITHNRSQY